ncbi:MAG: hypothetical protein RL625_1203 [Gemmatimonadota bacterium]|jgi:hypothetical protein
MTESIRVFVNGAGVSVPPGSALLAAVRAADPDAAAAIESGTRAIADSRGIVVDPATLVTGGFVMRLVSGKTKTGTAPTDD